MHHLELLVDPVVARRRRDKNARQQHIEIDMGKMAGLCHYILSGQVVTALSEDMNQKLCRDVTVDIEIGVLIAFWIILLH